MKYNFLELYYCYHYFITSYLLSLLYIGWLLVMIDIILPLSHYRLSCDWWMGGWLVVVVFYRRLFVWLSFNLPPRITMLLRGDERVLLKLGI